MKDKLILLKDILSPLTISQKSNDRELIVKCPYCGDKNDSRHEITGHYHMYISVEKGLFHCFLCGHSGNIKQLITDNKDKLNLSNENIKELSRYYIFPSLHKSIPIRNLATVNLDIKEYIEKLNIDNNGLQHLYDRIKIKEKDNKQFLYHIVNSRIIIPSNSTYIPFKPKMEYILRNSHYVIPLGFYSGIQLYLPHNDPKYILLSVNKDIPTYIYFGNTVNPSKIYIVEGIFDGLKLYNILNMDPNIMILVLTGKTKTKSIIYIIKSLKIKNYSNIEYIFALDSDLNEQEYIRLVNIFKNSYYSTHYKISILKWKDKQYKDIGEITSEDEFNNKLIKVDFKLFVLKRIYDKIF